MTVYVEALTGTSLLSCSFKGQKLSRGKIKSLYYLTICKWLNPLKKQLTFKLQKQSKYFEPFYNTDETLFCNVYQIKLCSF